MIKILSLFSGIGAFEKSISNIGLDYELVNYCEIDKFASKSYCAIHNVSEEKNLWDVTRINPETLEDFDLLTHGSPCTDISLAGLQKGADENSGTRSSLLWHSVKIIKAKKPRTIIWENVANILSKNHIHNLEKYLSELESIGYKNFYKVLNASDYGIPQSRKRIFVVSILDGDFEFPKPIELKIRLKDILEEKVDEKYFLTEKALERIKKHKNKVFENPMPDTSKTLMAGYYKQGGRDQQYVGIKVAYNLDTKYEEDGRVYDTQGICPTLKARPCNHKILCLNSKKDDGTETYQQDRVYHSDGISPCLSTAIKLNVHHNFRIRRLTPCECFRLMGFSDSDFKKIKDAKVSDSQAYKQAGNSICVPVIEHIFRNIYK